MDHHRQHARSQPSRFKLHRIAQCHATCHVEDRSFGSGQQPHLLHLLLLQNIHYIYYFFVADAFIARNYHGLLGVYGLLPFDCFDEFCLG